MTTHHRTITLVLSWSLLLILLAITVAADFFVVLWLIAMFAQ